MKLQAPPKWLAWQFPILVCSGLVCWASWVAAQTSDSLSVPNAGLQKDIRDYVFKRPLAKQRTKPLEVGLVGGPGYTLVTGFALSVGINAVFKTAHQPGTKFSSFSLGLTYSQYSQVIANLFGDVWSGNGHWHHTTDWRILQFPSQTWGLAGKEDPNDGYTIDFSYLRLHQTVLRRVTNHVFAGAGVFYDRIWNIQEVNAPPNSNTSFQRYRVYRDETAVAIPFRLLLDSRLNQVNPQQGVYTSITVRNNLTALGSKQNWNALVVDARAYARLNNKRNILGFWFYSWNTSQRTPYLLLPSTGWDETSNLGRGYIQGRFRGYNLHYLESEFRFKLTHNGLLGGVAFANVQAYRPLFSSGVYYLEPAFGAGLRVKINKFSNTNICLDYGIGQAGSQGIFINLGEVF